MGINNDIKLCYGVEFSYDEIEQLKNHPEFKKLAEEIGCDSMPNLWQEMGFITCSNYYDQEEEYYNYIIGVELEGDVNASDFIKQLNDDTINYVKEECAKYNLLCNELKIICRVNVW